MLLKALKYIDLVIYALTHMHAYIHVYTYTQSQPQTQVLTRLKPARKREVRRRGPKQFGGVANKWPLRGSSSMWPQERDYSLCQELWSYSVLLD